jgi:hypothetical protein
VIHARSRRSRLRLARAAIRARHQHCPRRTRLRIARIRTRARHEHCRRRSGLRLAGAATRAYRFTGTARAATRACRFTGTARTASGTSRTCIQIRHGILLRDRAQVRRASAFDARQSERALRAALALLAAFIDLERA